MLVWKKSLEFVKLVYRLSTHFPKEEIYGLTSQLKRASVSVLANIVEGRSRRTQKEFVNFLYIANGSLSECRCYFELALELNFITPVQYNFISNKGNELGYLLHKFIDTVSKTP